MIRQDSQAVSGGKLQTQGTAAAPGGRRLTSIEAMVERVQSVERDATVAEQTPFEPINHGTGSYREILVDLSTGTFLHRFNGRAFGVAIIYEGTNPGARLDLEFKGGGLLTNQPPGTFLPVQFDQLEISRGSRSATIGNARLVVLLDRSTRYVMPEASGQAVGSYALGSASAFSAIQGEGALPPTHFITHASQTVNFVEGLTVTGGTSGATGVIASQIDNGTTGTLYLASVTGTFQAAEVITASTGSSTCDGAQTAISGGAAPTSFEVTGFTKMTLLVDTVTGGTNATSFDLVPWFYDPDLNAWLDQTMAVINVPDSSTTLQRYRVVQLDLTGLRGRVFFQIMNLLASARTGLAFKVLGVS